MKQFSISSKQLRALILLLLLLPLVPTALVGRAMITSAIKETKEIQAMVEDFHQHQIQSLLDLLAERQKDRGEPTPLPPNQVFSERTLLELPIMLGQYDSFSIKSPNGTLLAGTNKPLKLITLDFDASSISEGAVLVVHFDIGKEESALAFATIRTGFIVTGLILIGIVTITLLVGWIIRRQLRIEALKSDFLATVSHELKTPIASSRILIDTLRDEPELPRSQINEYAELLATENERMEHLVAQFLTYSRLGKDATKLEITPIDPENVIDLAVIEVRPNIEAEGGTLEMIHPDNLPKVKGDQNALVTILTSLLDNARKYGGNPPQISLSVNQSDTHLTFAIQDNGTGIAKGDLPHLFEPFFQADSRLSRSREGCGLGLAIADQLARSLYSQIEITTSESGSTFSLDLPLAR